MKNLILTFSLLLTFLGTAQIPDYFGNNPRWNVGFFLSGYISPTVDDTYWNYEYYIKDTVEINGVNYNRLFEKGYNYSPMFNPPPYTYNHFDQFAGKYVRQEDRKIFIINDNSNVEKLVIDFNLSVGDTIKGLYECLSIPIVTSVDSILIDNEYFKVLYVDNPSGDSYEVIEGIGAVVNQSWSNIGLIFDEYFYMEYSERSLYCYSRNGESKWINQDASCYVAAEIAESDQSIDFSIYPNPATNEITISHDYNGNLEYEILDLSGRRIFSSVSKKNDISNLTSGVYLVALKLDGKVNGVEKLIVND